jgi:hypothetical protein
METNAAPWFQRLAEAGIHVARALATISDSQRSDTTPRHTLSHAWKKLTIECI